MSNPTVPISVSVHTELGHITLSGLMSEYIGINNAFPPYYTHHSQCRDFYVDVEGMESFAIRLDERGSNCLHDLYIKSKLHRTIKPTKLQISVYNYIHTVFWELKNSNPLYGTFDFKNCKRTGIDGTKPLYTHDFFAYLASYCRNKKIDEILTDLENDTV